MKIAKPGTLSGTASVTVSGGIATFAGLIALGLVRLQIGGHEQYRELEPGSIRPDHDPAIVRGMESVDPAAIPDSWPVFDKLAELELRAVAADRSGTRIGHGASQRVLAAAGARAPSRGDGYANSAALQSSRSSRRISFSARVT